MRNNEEPLLNNRDFQRMQDQIKNSLVTIIDNEIKERHWTQVRAATELGTTQPRISNLHNHAVNKFSIQSLIMFAWKLGHKVKINRQTFEL